MNTLFHLSATGALFWLSLYAYDDLSNGVLGTAALGMALGFFILTILTLGDDRDMVRKFKGRKDDED